MIPLNNNESSELPYIGFPEHNLNFLIVSGSTNSFFDPQITYKLFPNYVKNAPFIVSAVFRKSSHQQSASISAFKIFNFPNPMNLKFFLIKFLNF